MKLLHTTHNSLLYNRIMELENIDGNCISVISEYIPDYISFALVSRQFRDSWVSEKKTSKKLLKEYVINGNLKMVEYYVKNGCPCLWDEEVCSYAAEKYRWKLYFSCFRVCKF